MSNERSSLKWLGSRFYNPFYKLLVYQRILQYRARNFFDKIFHKYPFENLKIRNIPPKKFYIFSYGPTGDIALLSSLTQYIKRKFPKTNIYFITSAKYRYLASLNPDIKKVISIDLPTFFTYRDIEMFAQKFDYDIFLIASPHPNLRYLIPLLPIIKMSFFLFRDIPDKIPVPRLKFNPPKKRTKKYFVLNLEAATFGWHKNMPKFEEVKRMKKKILEANPDTFFYINQKESIIDDSETKNSKIYNGNLRGLLNLMANSQGIISMRNGLNDVMASCSLVPQFILYPEGNFPDERGIDCIKWAGLRNIGYRSKIVESRINRHYPNSIDKNIMKINKFIKDVSKKQ